MKRFRLFIQRHKMLLLIVGIICLAALLRFYHYDARWGLAYDQAHDALVAREALIEHKLPLLGPFSSAGAFVTGPEWYWFIMLATIIAPMFVITPWIVLTVLSVFLVYLMFVIGRKMDGIFFGLSAALLTAVSSAEIAQGINLTNQAPLTILCGAAIFFLHDYYQTKKAFSLFWVGFFVSLGINTHLQGVLLIPMVVIPLVISLSNLFRHKPLSKNDIGIFARTVLLASVGFLLPFLPLLSFDTTHHFYDLRSMWQYYRYDQYKISLDVLGRNWRTYLGIFWPNALAYITGGNLLFSFLLIGVFFIALFRQTWQKKLSKTIVTLLITFFIALLFMRYTRTPLFNSYLMYLHPIIFLLISWSLLFIFRKKKIFAVCLLLLAAAGSMLVDIHEMSGAQNLTAKKVILWEHILEQRYPRKKFTIYDYGYKTSGLSAPLNLFLLTDNRTSNDGVKVGVVDAVNSTNTFQIIAGKGDMSQQLYYLTSSSSAQLVRAGWKIITPESIYSATEEWYRDQ